MYCKYSYRETDLIHMRPRKANRGKEKDDSRRLAICLATRQAQIEASHIIHHDFCSM